MEPAGNRHQIGSIDPQVECPLESATGEQRKTARTDSIRDLARQQPERLGPGHAQLEQLALGRPHEILHPEGITRFSTRRLVRSDKRRYAPPAGPVRQLAKP